MLKTINLTSAVKHFSIVVFAIFLGSQITEGVLLVPYWKSLTAQEFYAYYAKFGPLIGRFYTILTIIAALIPIAVSVRFVVKKHEGAVYAVLSSFFAILFILCFYIYFKGVNEKFYQSFYSEKDLSLELVKWSYWHWSRIGIEIVSLFFLIISLASFRNEEEDENIN